MDVKGGSVGCCVRVRSKYGGNFVTGSVDELGTRLPGNYVEYYGQYHTRIRHVKGLSRAKAGRYMLLPLAGPQPFCSTYHI